MRFYTSKSVTRSEPRAREVCAPWGGPAGESLPATGVRHRWILIVGLLIASASCRFADASQIDYTGLEMERLCTPPEACTGLVFGIDGEGYVSSGSTVYRFDVRRDAGAYELVSWSEAVAPRGHAILADGDHILCDGARVVRISRDGERRDALATAILSAPRDLCAAPGNEGVFVVGAGDDSDSLLYVPLATDDAVVLDDTLEQPTAVALSPDDRTLYVIESATGRVLAYDLAGSGSIGPRRELATLPGGEGVAQDVCVDKDGFLWLARGTAIDVLGADGRHVARIPTPAITSLAFGDSSLRVMFCAGGGSEGGGIVGRYFVGVRGVAVARNRE